MTPEIAAEALQTTPREIDRLIDLGALHPAGEAANAKLICANSLPADAEGQSDSGWSKLQAAGEQNLKGEGQ
jgi:hypothetical protein